MGWLFSTPEVQEGVPEGPQLAGPFCICDREFVDQTLALGEQMPYSLSLKLNVC